MLAGFLHSLGAIVDLHREVRLGPATDFADTDAERRMTLKHRILTATGLLFSGFALSQLVRLGGNLVTTRLLAPELFGVMALANAFVTAAIMLSDTGLTSNIQRHRDGENRSFLQTAFSITVAQGAILALIIVSIGALVGLLGSMQLLPANSAYAHPDLPFATQLLAISVIIRSLSSIEVHICRRRLQLSRVVGLELVSQIVALAIAIAYAYHSPSIHALVLSSLASAATFTIGSYLCLSRANIGFGWNREHANNMFHYGKWIAGSSAIGLISQHGDKLIFAFLFTATQMGHYAIAALIFVAADAVFNKINEIWLPVFSELMRDSPEKVAQVYYKIRLVRDTLVAMIAGPLLACGDLIIQVLYDARYAEAGWMLQILAITFFIDAFRSVKEKLVLAAGNSRMIFLLTLMRSISTVALIFILYAAFGIVGAVTAYALRFLAGTAALFVYFRQQGYLQVRYELRTLAIAGAGIAAGLMARVLLT